MTTTGQATTHDNRDHPANTALILFAHGARDPEWAAPIRRIRALLGQRDADLRVELAFFEFMSPTLADCVARLIADGSRRIVVLPLFIASGGHLKRDIPALLADLRQRHPQTEFELAAPVGEADAVIQAMAEHAYGLLDRPA
ncbi:MAG: CbiX/SirB N-terminal domain-containing protein [Candidatus Accumulibacter sp.]|nr:CbiX/SirB N-terminal domain-containing protein [Accumulibacter sp.]